VKLTYPGSSSLYVDYDYLVTGEVTKIRENGATSGAGVLATFAYDPGSSPGQAYSAAARASPAAMAPRPPTVSTLCRGFPP
jgi:hypothetical protein